MRLAGLMMKNNCPAKARGRRRIKLPSHGNTARAYCLHLIHITGHHHDAFNAKQRQYAWNHVVRALVYFMAIEEAKFRKPVEPGVLLRLEVSFVQKRARVCKFAGRALVDGQVAGNKLTWKMEMTMPMPMTLECEAEVSGDSISGTMQLGAFGASAFSGTRRA